MSQNNIESELSYAFLHAVHDALLLRRCAYWVSLRGAPVSANASGQTVYLPKRQPFTPEGLSGLMARLSNIDFPRYQEGGTA